MTAPAPTRDADPARVVPLLRKRRRWAPPLSGALCALVGFGDIGSAVFRNEHARLNALLGHVPGTLRSASAAGTLVTGILLLLLARALRRRKRRAWLAVTVLLASSVVLHLLKGLDGAAAVSAALLLLLLALREEFYARGDPRTRWRAVATGLTLLSVSTVLGVSIVEIRRSQLATDNRPAAVLEHVVLGLVGADGPLEWKATPRGRRTDNLVGDCLLALGLLTAVTTTYLVLRPAEPQSVLSEADEDRMRDLLVRHGARDSLGYFALRRDKSVIWSPSGKACVSYRVLSGVMLASGDPLGDPEAWPGAIDAFMTEADAHAWVPAVMGCSETAGTAWARAGLDVLEIGDEAVVEVADFSLEGRPMRNVRQAVNRVERAGYTVAIRRVGDIPEHERSSLAAQANAWRGAQTERGFSMALGRFGDPKDQDCVVVLAFQQEQLRAFLHFVPWGKDGLSLDLMRRDRTADNGLNELLIVKALQEAPDRGISRLSLNFAVFRSSLERGERLGAGPVLRAWRGVLVFASRWFQIESLYRFNAKFHPVWEPRYVCFPATSSLPRVAVAALEAEAFLVWPVLRLPWNRKSA